MKYLYIIASTLLLFSQQSNATITNWAFTHNATYQQTDSLAYSYESGRDTTISRIYLETGAASSGLDTASDLHMYTIMIIDNKTEENSGDKKAIMPDKDPVNDKFLFSPGSVGLAPGLYRVALSDADGMRVDTFRITALTSPYRTVSGKVTPPQGKSAALINVKTTGKNLKIEFGALTDSTGSYTIGIDKKTVDSTSGEMQVMIDAKFPDYVPTPTFYGINLAVGNKTGLDFSFTKTTCIIKGVVTSSNGGLKDVRVMLTDEKGSSVGSIATDSTGHFQIGCAAGTYMLRLDMYLLQGTYIQPTETKVTVADGQTKDVTINVLKSDAAIYGRVTMNKLKPTTLFMIQAYLDSIGGNQVQTDSNGFFKIPIAASTKPYNVSIGKNGKIPFPEGFMVEGKEMVQAKAGDSVFFNLIAKPNGGISGTLSNTTTFTNVKFSITLNDTNKNMSMYTFDAGNAGSYTYSGVPDGIYYAFANMYPTNGNTANVKFGKSYNDQSGKKMPITITGSIVPNINFAFSAADTMKQGGDPQQQGKGVLFIQIIDSTGITFEKGSINVLDQVPVQNQQPSPIKFVQLNRADTVVKIPNLPSKVLYAIVELQGLDNKNNHVMYRSIVNTSTGEPKAFDFSKADSLTAAIVMNQKTLQTNNPVQMNGKGTITGTITYNGTLSVKKLFALLYDINKNESISGVSVDSNGTYKLGNVPVGKFKVMAMIDTNGDKTPELMAGNDSVLVILDAEVYTGINIALKDKATGTGKISGTLQSAEELPAKVSITITAIPVDTTKPDSIYFNNTTLMTGYLTKAASRTSFNIGNLPDGVYYVVAMVEQLDSLNKEMGSVGFGVYGNPILNVSTAFPFDATPVIIKDGKAVDNIAIMIVKNTKGNNAVVMSTSLIPNQFTLNNARFLRQSDNLQISINLPRTTSASFSIVDLRGRVVLQLAQASYPAGYLNVRWQGISLRTGTYIIKMKSSDFIANKVIKIVR